MESLFWLAFGSCDKNQLGEEKIYVVYRLLSIPEGGVKAETQGSGLKLQSVEEGDLLARSAAFRP